MGPAKLQVEVLNPHRSRSRWFRKPDWTIMADRLVRLVEGGVEVRFDTCMVSVEVRLAGGDLRARRVQASGTGLVPGRAEGHG